jgi:hypothetical protein
VKRGRSADWRSVRSIGTALNVDLAMLRPVDVAKKYGVRAPVSQPAPPAAPPAKAAPAITKKAARETGARQRTRDAAVRAVIDLADSGCNGGVAGATRELAPRYSMNPEALEQAYYRHHRRLRTEMAAAQRMSAGAAAPKMSVATRKVSVGPRPAPPKVSVPQKNSGRGRAPKT